MRRELGEDKKKLWIEEEETLAAPKKTSVS